MFHNGGKQCYQSTLTLPNLQAHTTALRNEDASERQTIDNLGACQNVGLMHNLEGV